MLPRPDPGAPPPRRPARPGNAFDCGPRAWIDPAGLDFSFSRSGGPGGQNVNKVHSRAELMVKLASIHGLDERALDRLRDAAGSHLVHGDTLRFTAEEHRSQKANKDACLERLRELVLRASIPPKVRRKTKPTRGSIERRLESKKREGEKKRQRRWDGA
ncbi:MAG: aminoacyl-tRNA hydrolase [Planctomycetes bacterium]|nr:aminoacyl-tRNA hydrolase [Planctomycetota bacterium]